MLGNIFINFILFSKQNLFFIHFKTCTILFMRLNTNITLTFNWQKGVFFLLKLPGALVSVPTPLGPPCIPRLCHRSIDQTRSFVVPMVSGYSAHSFGKYSRSIDLLPSLASYHGGGHVHTTSKGLERRWGIPSEWSDTLKTSEIINRLRSPLLAYIDEPKQIRDDNATEIIIPSTTNGTRNFARIDYQHNVLRTFIVRFVRFSKT